MSTAELQAGKILPEIAKEHNVEWATVQKTLSDARKTALGKAVADGLLTQKQADLMLDHMDDMWQNFGGTGFGPGGEIMGPGWGRGRGIMGSGLGRGMMGRGFQTPQSQ